jgi:hypothetical protein
VNPAPTRHPRTHIRTSGNSRPARARILSRLGAVRKISLKDSVFPRIKRFIALSLAVIAAWFLLGMTTSSSASAVSCYGDYCSGKNPNSTGCANDAYTVTSFNYATASLQLRWSPTCRTNWARLVVYPPGVRIFNYGSLWAIQDTGYNQSVNTLSVSGYSSATFYTAMIYSPVHCVKAVFYNAYHTYDSVQTGCY